MKAPISVITSVKNGEKYIQRCINSIIEQTFENFEFLIIDDGSDDNTWDILKKNKDRRIKLFKNRKSIGLTKSLNYLIKISSGDFIARIDADDVSRQSRFKNQIEFLKNSSFCCAASGCLILDGEGKEKYQLCPATNYKKLKWNLIFRNNIRHSSVMWKREVEQEYDSNFICAQDYEMWCRMIRNNCEIGIINEILTEVYEHSETITQKLGNMQEAMACLVTKKQAEHYLKKDISNAEAKKLRLMHAQKSILQIIQFNEMSQEEIKETSKLYLNIAGEFFSREKIEEKSIVEEIKRDLDPSNSNILEGVKDWVNTQKSGEFKSLIENSYK